MELIEVFNYILLPILFGLFGLCFGSFSNVLIYRFSNHIKLTMTSRSECTTCHHQLAWYDNIPLFSYMFLGGKCRYCKEHISIRYPVVEAVGTLIFLTCFYFFNYGCFTENFGVYAFSYKSVVYSFILLDLFVMAWIDYNTMEVPLTLQYILVALCISLYVTDCILLRDYLLVNLIGLGAAVVLLLGTYFLFILIRKQEGLGLADVTLLCALALSQNIFNFVLILLLSSLSCAIIELIKAKVTKENKPFPFVPYIAGASAIVIFFGNAFYNSILPGLF